MIELDIFFRSVRKSTYSFTMMLVLLISGCTSLMHYDNYLARYLGYSQGNLIEVFGHPSDVWERDGQFYMLYRTHKNISYHISEGTSEQVAVQPAQTCETLFILENDAVFAWRYQGDGCEIQ